MYRTRTPGFGRSAGWLALLVMLVGCGRSLSAASLPSSLDDLLRPTWTPAFAEQAAITLDPAQSPEPARTEKPARTHIPFALGEDVYHHPDGLLQFPRPAGWTVTEEQTDQVLLTDPRWPRSVRIGVTRTGAALDGPAFERFVAAREANLFADQGVYEVLAQTVDTAGPSNTARLEKLKTGDLQSVRAISFYRQSGDAVLWLDYQQADYLSPYLEPPPDDWMGQVRVDARQAGLLTPYAEWVDLSDPGGLYELAIPAAWSHREVVRDSVVAHLVESPDRNNRIQLILFDEGLPVSSQDAGNLALELLRSLNTSPILVSAAIVRSDGIEYLLWNRADNGSRGQSFFAVRENTFLMLTFLQVDPENDQDRTTTQAVQNSFRLP